MFSFSFAFHSSIGFADCQVTCTTETIYSFTRRSQSQNECVCRIRYLRDL